MSPLAQRNAAIAVIVVLAIGAAWQIATLRAEVARLKANSAPDPAPTSVAVQPSPAPILAPPPVTRPATALAIPEPAREALSPERRAAILDVLTREPTPDSHTISFIVAPGNPGAAALQRAIGGAFTEAGWQIPSTATAGFPIKPGVFVMVAEDDPPLATTIAIRALEAAEIELTIGLGYRAYYDQMKAEKPSWVGFDFPAGQQWVVVIGRVEG